jgi:hypothetical protein
MDMEGVMELLLVIKKKMESHHEKMNTSQTWMIAKMDAWLAEMRTWRKETMAYLESKEPIPS